MINLYPFQAESKEALRANMRAGIRSQVLCSPTGSGKTEIAMSIIMDAIARDSRVLFIADRQTLVTQTSQRFADNGIAHGVAMGEHTFGRSEQIQVCSAQTLEKREFLVTGNQAVDLAVVDECHEIRKKLMQMLKARGSRILGLSATPFTSGLGKLYDEVVNVTTTDKLVADGYLSKLQIVGSDAEVDVDGLPVGNHGEWQKRELSDRVLSIVGEIVPEWERNTREFFGGPVETIVFCASVADCEETAAKFQLAGHDFQVIHYRQSATEKQEIIKRYRDQEHLGLISCVALTKGFDVPSTRCMIDAYPLRRAFALHIQKLGRVMRRAEGKEFGLVIDHSGNWLGFLGPTKAFFASGCNTLDDGVAKAKVVRAKKVDTEHHQCKNCGYMLEELATQCPVCGAERKRPRGRVHSLPGRLAYLDEVTGEFADTHVDWWTEICAVSTQLYPRNHDKARRVALAKYQGIFEKWPDREFKAVTREPHLLVKQVCDEEFRRWQRQQHAAKRAMVNR